jgi:hypothetical protein
MEHPAGRLTRTARSGASRRAAQGLGAAAAWLALLAGSSAHAAEPSTAEVLFREGRELLARGDTAAACPKLEESQRLDPAPGTEFNLARCYELLGRYASAWGAYADVAEVTHSLGQREREMRAREQVAAIEPRLSFVVVKAAAPADGLRLTRDGVDVSLAQLEVAIPIDPGDHVLAASAPGRHPWETHFRVSHEAERVTVEVPPLELAPNEPGPGSGAGATTPTDANARPPADNGPDLHPPATVSSRGSTQRVIALALLGTSLVAAGCGTYFGIEAIQFGNESREGGPNAHGAYGQSQQNGDLATATFIGFGVLALAGGVLWFTAPRAPKPPPGARLELTWTATSKGAGAFLTGSW